MPLERAHLLPTAPFPRLAYHPLRRTDPVFSGRGRFCLGVRVETLTPLHLTIPKVSLGFAAKTQIGFNSSNALCVPCTRVREVGNSLRNSENAQKSASWTKYDFCESLNTGSSMMRCVGML